MFLFFLEMPYAGSVHFIGLDHTMPVVHGLCTAARFDSHDHRQTDRLRPVRFQMKEVSCFENPPFTSP